MELKVFLRCDYLELDKVTQYFKNMLKVLHIVFKQNKIDNYFRPQETFREQNNRSFSQLASSDESETELMPCPLGTSKRELYTHFEQTCSAE